MERTETVHDDINEDTLQCLFFLPETNITDPEQMCTKINKVIETMSDGYIWHHDEFRVYIPIHSSENDIPHLASTTYFGDNVEDEWFIVYIVYEITKLFDLIVQLKDSDDNFLLIEAADYLPQWAKPETTYNRVYVYDNHIHIIPPAIDENNLLKVRDAIKILRERKEHTKASADIQSAIQNRIEKYKKIKDTTQVALVNLPLDIATLLKMKPNLISAIANAYCNHDIIDAKASRNLNFKDFVTVEIKFSKFLYAMLMHSKPIKSIRNFNTVENDKKSLLGLKLACGYSILMNKPVADVSSTKQYNKFISNLKINGYFKGELEGSKEYTNLLEKAKNFYVNVDCPLNLSFYYEVSQMMSTHEFKNVKQSLTNCAIINNNNEYNDDWLNIHPVQLDDFLNKQFSRNKITGDVADQTVKSKLSNFFKLTSDFEGIEISEEPEVIDFDSDDFKNAVEKMLNIISEADDVIDSDLSIETDDELLDDPKTMELMDLQENKESVLKNLVQSIKEEGGSSGPSSNILKNIGLHKSDFLDSDDD